MYAVFPLMQPHCLTIPSFAFIKSVYVILGNLQIVGSFNNNNNNNSNFLYYFKSIVFWFNKKMYLKGK